MYQSYGAGNTVIRHVGEMSHVSFFQILFGVQAVFETPFWHSMAWVAGVRNKKEKLFWGADAFETQGFSTYEALSARGERRRGIRAGVLLQAQ